MVKKTKTGIKLTTRKDNIKMKKKYLCHRAKLIARNHFFCFAEKTEREKKGYNTQVLDTGNPVTAINPHSVIEKLFK